MRKSTDVRNLDLMKKRPKLLHLNKNLKVLDLRKIKKDAKNVEIILCLIHKFNFIIIVCG